MKILSVFVIITVLVLVCEGKVFTRCQLASELLKLNIFKKTFLGSWVCLIEKVSSRNTKALTVTTGGKKIYGLYQIPQKYCREGKRGGACNVACESLLDDDIRDDTLCAEQIFQQEGFKFWTQWTTRCKNDNFITTEIYKCPALNPQRNSVSPERRYSEVLKYKRLMHRRSINRFKSTYTADQNKEELVLNSPSTQ